MSEPADCKADLIHCARCNGDHKGLVFKPFRVPANAGPDKKPVYTHWATCPTTGEPIMLYMTAMPEYREG